MGERAAGALNDMHAWLVPRIVFPLYERLSGDRFWTEVLRLRDLRRLDGGQEHLPLRQGFPNPA
jgi:hypothetical protein